MTMTQPPQRVMRFYGNVQYALEPIAFKQITFLHIDKLNDPFDPYYYFETEDYQEIINYIQQHHANKLIDFKQILPKENWERAVKQIKEYLDWSSNNTFVLSTIEINEDKNPKDDLYMWSHYGNGHRGAAIEFDTTLLAKAVLEQMKKQHDTTNDINDVWSKIDYKKEPPKITCEQIVHYVMDLDKTKLEEVMVQRFSSKSVVWETEQEWRLMWRNDETRIKILKLDLMDDTIYAAYLGCRIADNIKDDFIFETKRHFPKAKIFKARKAKGKFALDFERIALPANANLTENGKRAC
jgi:hypothetical protein